MTRDEMRALIERVETAIRPDRELDAEIAVATGGYCWQPTQAGATLAWLRGNSIVLPGNGDRLMLAPAYTASFDAAMTLLPAGWRVNTADWSIPGVYSWTLRGPCQRYVTGADGWDEPGDDWFHSATAVTPALALTAAALRARPAPMESEP